MTPREKGRYQLQNQKIAAVKAICDKEIMVWLS